MPGRPRMTLKKLEDLRARSAAILSEITDMAGKYRPPRPAEGWERPWDDGMEAVCELIDNLDQIIDRQRAKVEGLAVALPATNDDDDAADGAGKGGVAAGGGRGRL